MFDETKNLSAFRSSRFLFYLGFLFIAQTTWRPALSFTLSDWIFLAAVLSILPFWLMQCKVDVPISKPILLGLGLILLGGLLSTPGVKWPLSSEIQEREMSIVVYLVGCNP